VHTEFPDRARLPAVPFLFTDRDKLMIENF